MRCYFELQALFEKYLIYFWDYFWEKSKIVYLWYNRVLFQCREDRRDALAGGMAGEREIYFMSMIFETHAHYNDEAFLEDREKIFAQFPEKRIGRVVNIASDLESIDECLELAEKYPFMYCALGIHPSDCAPLTDELLAQIRGKLQNPRVVAVGEIGLDYYWIKDPEMAVQAQFVLGNEIQWYRQVYIEVFDGVYVMSDKMNLTLSEGDIVFEEAGTCEQLQVLLDEAYYSMPVDAEQNKNGGYMVHDQRHEKRVVLDDPSAPLYRLKISDKVQEFMKEDGRLPAYMYTEREDALPLMIYPGYGNLRISVYKVYGTKDTGTQYESLTVDDLFYFGTHHLVGLDE